MSARSFERWADSLVQEGIISREDAGLYSYGLEQGLLLLLNIGTALLIGLLLDEFVACVIFLACFLPLRAMAGGYHARTPLHCYLLGMMVVTATLAAIKWLPWTLEGTLIAAAIASAIIWRLAPVEDENKPLNKEEMQKFKHKSKLMIFVSWVEIIIAVCINSINSSIVLMMAILAEGLMVVVKILKQSKVTNERRN